MHPLISTSKLTKEYGSSIALSDLSIDIQEGEVFGYLGPNGAGKTTTIRLLLGLIRATSGTASIFGLDCLHDKIEIHKRIAYVPGEATLWPSLTGAETLRLLGNIHGEVDIDYMKKLIALFQFNPHKKVRTYSKGNRQKINLIAAFMTRASLLILDEPTSGLDPIMEQVFKDCIHEAKQRGQTVFLSSHILDEVQALCDRIAILQSGKLIEVGTLEQMRHLSAVTIKATFESTPPDVSKVAGISSIQINGNELNCQLQGDISQLLGIISAAYPKTFLSSEPSLEDLFLQIYAVKENQANSLQQ